ncbi:MAG: hypothetical protein O9325_03520, partial [Roseomonas sp.]|nr:hypothetical protein [Roseomonas sp.]
MRIARVEPAFSQPERRLLRLLARLYAYQEQMEGRDKGNWDMCVVPLSDSELDELRDLLDDLVLSQEFLAKSYFVENIYRKNMDAQLERRLRELYFSERSARGRRNRTMSGRHWGDFKARLGIAPSIIPLFRLGKKPAELAG